MGKVIQTIEILLNEKGKKDVDKEAEYCEWYDGPTNPINDSEMISKYIPLVFYTRKMIEDKDVLTGEIYKHYNTKSRNIAIVETDLFKKLNELFIIFEEGTTNAVTIITKILGLKVTARKRNSFSQDFIEFLNTSEPSDNGYSQIFDNDMESYSRKAKGKYHHYLAEGYSDIASREQNINEEFREAAGVKISPKINFSKLLPTIEVTLFKDDWINLSHPKIEEGESTFYKAVLYSYKRLAEAFDTFNTL